MNEDNLMERARGGDADAFDRLLRPHREVMLRLAFRAIGNEEDAREVCQEAGIRIFRYLGSFRPGHSFRSWVCRIVLNCANDVWRHRKRYETMIENQQKHTSGYSSIDPEKTFLDREIHEKIQICLSGLSRREKSVFLLRDAEGLSIRETVDVLGYSSASVRTYLCRARKKIRSAMEKYRLLEGAEGGSG
ncbi:MAG: RNA polymerase sigma factor [Candidatus Aminicenantes bacterium]|nr:RNA polymerase sigma factor [Candidatus Aminicenantes bacterium]